MNEWNDIKINFTLTCIVATMRACSQGSGDKSTDKETVFSRKDSQGRVVEQWGNEETWDKDRNFRYSFDYDSLGRLRDEKL